jgi:hypothetical protein
MALKILLDVQLLIQNVPSLIAVDFEFYSLTGTGAIQGQGYLYRNGNKSVNYARKN